MGGMVDVSGLGRQVDGAKAGDLSGRVYAVLLGLVLLLGGAWRVYLFYSGRLPFDSDQAVFGLAGQHLLAGGRHYIMLPGQGYGGYYPAYYFMLLHAWFPPSVALMRPIRSSSFRTFGSRPMMSLKS